MTVLLVLFFIILALLADEVVKYSHRSQASRLTTIKINGMIQEIFNHDGMCPTMADGGEKVITEKKNGNSEGVQAPQK